MELLVEEQNVSAFADLMQRDWDESLRREGTGSAPAAGDAAGPASEDQCPACGSVAALVDGACPDCGLHLD